MGTLRYISLTALLAAAATAVATEPADSVATDSIAAIEKAMSKKLDEVTVEGKTHWHNVKGSTYLPTKKQKNAAATATDLLALMAIPEIRATLASETVTTRDGQSVSLFVNYFPADANDLTGMRVQDCARVEYLVAPTDPRFQGAEYVINFIMQEYEYGGYTKIMAVQRILDINYNKENLFSRFTYRKMTFDILTNPTYLIDNHSGSSTYSTLRLTNADGNEYLLHRNQIYDKSHYRRLEVPVTFRATYNSEKLQFRNTLSFSHSHYYKCQSSGKLVYEPSLGEDYSWLTNNPSRVNSLAYNGSLYISLPREFSLSFAPQFIYTHTNSTSIYSRSGADIVDRNARENAYRILGKLNLRKQFGQKHSVFFEILGGDDISRLIYSGTNNFDDKYYSSILAGTIGYAFFINNLMVNIDGGYAWEQSSINGLKANDYYPFAHLFSRWSINSKNAATLSFQYATNSTAISQRASDVITSNEFMDKTGNPNLRNSRHITLRLYYDYTINSNISLYAGGSFFMLSDRPAEEYIPYNEGRQLIRQIYNSGNYYKGNIQAGTDLSLFNKKVSFSIGPNLSMYKTTGIGATSFTDFSFYARAQYHFGDFTLYGSVNSPAKQFGETNGVIYKPDWSYSLYLIWGKNEWNVRLETFNIFGKGWNNGTSKMESPYYSFLRYNYGTGRHPGIGLCVSYTFGYGKKVMRGNESENVQQAQSAIM